MKEVNKYISVCIHFTYTMYTMNTMYTYLHNEHKFVQSVFSGLDWTGLASDPLSRTGLDQDHQLTDLDWTGFFRMNPFHTLVKIKIAEDQAPKFIDSMEQIEERRH